MNRFEQLLASEGHVLLDGAMGTMLFAAGLESGAPPEEWNVIRPEELRKIHRAYIEAGSRIILTNSFGGTRFRLKLHNLQDRAHELNLAAAANARAEADAVSHLVVVAGSMGPTGELLQPMGNMTYEEAVAAFAEQAVALAEGGVDVLWIETMSDLNEVKTAVDGIRSVTDLPICATMTFDTRGCTMMGVTPVEAVTTLREWGITAIGGNCGNGPDEIEGVIAAMHQAAPDIPLIAKSNAGIPKWIDNRLIYDGTPEVMGLYARRVYGLGARLVGGCCGNTPEHIQTMNAALAAGGFERVEMETAESANGPTRQRERRHRR